MSLPDIIRWITPPPGALEKVVDYREKLKFSRAISSSQKSGSSQGKTRRIAASYIAIVRDSSVRDVSIIGKQVYQISQNSEVNGRLKGLKVLPKVFETERKPWIEVYFVPETLCKKFNIRIHKKCRKRKGKKDGQTSGCTQDFESMEIDCAEVPVDEDLVRTPSHTQQEPGTADKVMASQAATSSQDPFVDWEPYDPYCTIRSSGILYNKSCWSHWSNKNALEKIKNLTVADAVKYLRESLIQQRVKDNAPHNISAVVSTFQYESLDKILEKVISFHKKLSNIHPLVRSCVHHWVRRKFLKDEARKEKMASRSKKTPVAANRLPASSARPISQQSPAKTGADLRISLGLQKRVHYSCVIAAISQVLHLNGAERILGSVSNRRAFFRYLRKLLLLGGSKCSLPLSLCMKRLKPDDCQWLVSGTSNSTLKVHVLAKAVSWLMSELVLPMIRWSFYVTDRADTRYQLHFYLRDTWTSVSRTLESEYVRKKYVKIVRRGKSREANSKLRFVPKASNRARSILSYLKEFKRKSKNIGGKLLLTYVSEKLAPYGMGDGSLLEKRWTEFLGEWETRGRPTLYFVKADIRDAYPSVQLKKLQTILDGLCLGEKLYSLTYKSFKPRFRVKHFAWHSKITDPPHVRDRPWKSWKRDKVEDFDCQLHLNEIKAVLTSPVIKIGSQSYKFKHGLPQGWQLSSLLCNIYYGHMDRQYFSEFLDTPGEFFVRNIDDYCYVSPDPIRVHQFYQALYAGIPEYNCHINPAKTTHNLKVSSNCSFDDKSNCVIKFVGWNFCLSTGHVGRDFDSYAGLDTSSTLSFMMKPTMNPHYAIEFITNRLLYLSPLRIHSILVNPGFNCKTKILMNAFEAGLMSAFRFYALCRVVLADWKEADEKNFVSKIYCGIVSCANMISRVIMNHIDRNQSKTTKIRIHHCHNDKGCSCHVDSSGSKVDAGDPVTKPELVYVILTGFILKLRRHKEVFKRNLLPLLNFKLKKISQDLSPPQTYLLTCISGRFPAAFAAMKK